MTYQGITRRGKTQKIVNKNCHSRGMLSGIYAFFNHTQGGDPRYRPSGMTPCLTGFTLIELLVVVLIIGILAAVAVPQYQVAVQKAKLMKYVPIVRALNEAEQVYFLANGTFTYNLKELDVDLPVENCTYIYDSSNGYYQCGNERYGVWGNIANAQAGDDKIRYLQFFADFDQYNMKAGDVACYSKGEIARKACRSLGPGSEQVGVNPGSWEYIYTLAR